MDMEGDSMNPFALWARSIGLTPYERTSIRDGSGRSYRSSRLRRRRHNGDTNGNGDEDELNPSFHSSRRISSLFVATLQMAGSVLGAGVLFLLLPSPSTGQVPSHVMVQHPLLMVAALFLTERTGCLIVLVSRYAGVNNTQDLVRVAFGQTIHRLDAIGSFAFHLGILVCQQILLLEIGLSIMQEFDSFVLNLREDYSDNTGLIEQTGEEGRNLPLILATFGCILIICPMLFQREFQWIQIHLVAILVTSVILATTQHASGATNQRNNTQRDDAPIIVFTWLLLILFSHQVLKVQNTLQKPTRRRASWVVTLSVLFAIVMLILLGQTVTLFDHQSDNEVYSPGTMQILYEMVGRIGCVVSLLLTYGLQLPHTRRCLLHIIEFAFIDKTDPDQCRFVKDMCPDECCDEDAEDEETCVSFPSISTWSTSKSHVDVIQVAPDEETTLLPRIEEGLEPCNVYTNTFAHYTSTVGIILVSFGLACLLYIAKISAWSMWQWIAALFAPFFGLAAPAACFLQVQSRQAFLPWRMPWIVFCYISIAVAGTATVGAAGQLAYDNILSTPAFNSFLKCILFMVQ